jgi:hypothetical protein
MFERTPQPTKFELVIQSQTPHRHIVWQSPARLDLVQPALGRAQKSRWRRAFDWRLLHVI